jgi:hypothetical protein
VDCLTGSTPAKESVWSLDKVEGLSAAPAALSGIPPDLPPLDKSSIEPLFRRLAPATLGVPSRLACARTPERDIRLAIRELLSLLTFPAAAAVRAPIAPLQLSAPETTPSAYPVVMVEVLLDFLSRHPEGAQQGRANDYVR